jgi:hypothetical protein
MTTAEAKQIKPGDWLRANSLELEVEELVIENGEIFFVTKYGNFNASVCVRLLEPKGWVKHGRI